MSVRVVSMSSASKELRQGTVGIDCFLLGKLPGNDMLSFEPLFRRGLQLKCENKKKYKLFFFFHANKIIVKMLTLTCNLYDYFQS